MQLLQHAEQNSNFVIPKLFHFVEFGARVFTHAGAGSGAGAAEW